jgi:Tol biopolymer transport system component
MFVRRLYRRSRTGFATVVMAVAVVVPAAGARAVSSVLVYSCGRAFENLCQVNPDGSGRRQLTTDGAARFPARYISPSLSRDGRKLAYLRGYRLFVLDRATGKRTGPISNEALLARISPDGRKVGDLENFVSVNSLAVCVFNSNGTGHKSGRDCVGSTGSFGFTNNDRVLASVSAGFSYNYNKGICLLAADGTGCQSYIAADAAHDLWDPAVSPNGKLLAVTRATPTHVQGAIVLYDYATGRLVRQLTNGTTDSGPVWSPDGSHLAFVRGAMTNSPRIYTISVHGRAGSERQLVAKGRAVTWGR